MEAGAIRSVFACALIALTASWLVGCGEDSPSAVERLERKPGPVVTLVGAIDVGSPSGPEDVPEVFIRFYAPPDTALLEERQLLWSGSYRLEFSHDLVCGWSVDVTIWDGRTSERLPVAEDPPDRCEGFLQGPDFWFP